MKAEEYENINLELEIIEEKIKILRSVIDVCQLEDD